MKVEPADNLTVCVQAGFHHGNHLMGGADLKQQLT